PLGEQRCECHGTPPATTVGGGPSSDCTGAPPCRKMKNSDVSFLGMRTLDLAALEIFKTVADEGGITRAAAKLDRVQSNVTTRVKQLEGQLGTALFHRQGRKLVLSPEGRLLLGYADRLLRLSSEAEAVLRDGTPRGTLRLGALESTAATRLPPLLACYHR